MSWPEASQIHADRIVADPTVMMFETLTHHSKMKKGPTGGPFVHLAAGA
jgi:hypothetical protein